MTTFTVTASNLAPILPRCESPPGNQEASRGHVEEEEVMDNHDRADDQLKSQQLKQIVLQDILRDMTEKKIKECAELSQINAKTFAEIMAEKKKQRSQELVHRFSSATTDVVSDPSDNEATMLVEPDELNDPYKTPIKMVQINGVMKRIRILTPTKSADAALCDYVYGLIRESKPCLEMARDLHRLICLEIDYRTDVDVVDYPIPNNREFCKYAQGASMACLDRLRNECYRFTQTPIKNASEFRKRKMSDKLKVLSYDLICALQQGSLQKASNLQQQWQSEYCDQLH